MPYLRGTKPSAKYAAPSGLQAQVNALSRRVAQNTRQKNFWRKQYELPQSAGYDGLSIDVAAAFVIDPSYRTMVLGDKYTNHWIRLNWLLQNTTDLMRIIAYVPKKTGGFIAPPSDEESFLRIPDPAAYTVFHDQFYSVVDRGVDRAFKKVINLRNMVTNYNGSSSTMERGDLKIMVMKQGTGTTGDAFNVNLLYCISDK